MTSEGNQPELSLWGARAVTFSSQHSRRLAPVHFLLLSASLAKDDFCQKATRSLAYAEHGRSFQGAVFVFALVWRRRHSSSRFAVE